MLRTCLTGWGQQIFSLANPEDDLGRSDGVELPMAIYDPILDRRENSDSSRERVAISA
jgi:hypothetical protein